MCKTKVLTPLPSPLPQGAREQKSVDNINKVKRNFFWGKMYIIDIPIKDAQGILNCFKGVSYEQHTFIMINFCDDDSDDGDAPNIRYVHRRMNYLR